MFALPAPFTVQNQNTGRSWITADSVGFDLAGGGNFGESGLLVSPDESKHIFVFQASHRQIGAQNEFGGGIAVMTKPYDSLNPWSGWSNPRQFIGGQQTQYVRGDLFRFDNSVCSWNLDTPSIVWHPIRQKYMWYTQARPGERPGYQTQTYGDNIRVLMVGESDDINPTDPNWSVCWGPLNIILAPSDYPNLPWMQGWLNPPPEANYWGGLDEVVGVWNSTTQEMEVWFGPLSLADNQWNWGLAHARSKTGAGKFIMDQVLPTMTSGRPQGVPPNQLNPEGFPPVEEVSGNPGWGNANRAWQPGMTRDRFGRYHLWANQAHNNEGGGSPAGRGVYGIGIAHYYSDDKIQWYSNPNNPMIVPAELSTQSGHTVNFLAAPSVWIDENAGQWHLTLNGGTGGNRGEGNRMWLATSPLVTLP